MQLSKNETIKNNKTTTKLICKNYRNQATKEKIKDKMKRWFPLESVSIWDV